MDAKKRQLWKENAGFWIMLVVIIVAIVLLIAACGDDDAAVTTVSATGTTVVMSPTPPAVEGWVTEIHRINGRRLILEVQAPDGVYAVEVRTTPRDHAQSVALLKHFLRVGSDVRFPRDLWPIDPNKESCLGAEPVFCRINADALRVMPDPRG